MRLSHICGTACCLYPAKTDRILDRMRRDGMLSCLQADNLCAFRNNWQYLFLITSVLHDRVHSYTLLTPRFESSTESFP